MSYSLDDFLQESFKSKGNPDSVWSIPPFYPKPGDTSLLLLSEFSTDPNKERDQMGIPYIVRFYEYTIDGGTGRWQDNETYAWEQPGDLVHPEFDFEGLDPNDDNFDPDRAGLEPRIALYIFNISAYNALVGNKDIEEHTDMETAYFGDKYLKERDNFNGIQRWVMKKSVGGDFWNIMGSLRSKAKRKNDPSLLTLKRWVWDLNRKDAGITQYVLRRLDQPTYEQLDEELRSGVRSAVQAGSLPSLKEFVQVLKYDPENPKKKKGGGNQQRQQRQSVPVSVPVGPPADGDDDQPVFQDGEGDGGSGFTF